MANGSGPTLAGFTVFIRDVMGISTTVLPDADPVIPMALGVALAIVNPQLAAISPTYCGPPIPGVPQVNLYTLAVYNLGGDNIINFANDQPEAPIIPGSGDPGLPYFAWQREQLNLAGFVAGVIDASGDETTNQHMVVQEAAKMFTLSNLQNLKTIYGRRYLSIAQSYGPSTWGLS